MALSFSFLKKKKEEPRAFSNPQTAYQSLSNQAGSMMYPANQSKSTRQSTVPPQTQATYQGKILGSGLTSDYAANPSNTGPSSPGYIAPKPTQPKPQIPRPQVQQMRGSNYTSVLQNYLDKAGQSADQRAQIAASLPDRVAAQQQRLVNLAEQQAKQQAGTAQKRFDIFRENRLADIADLESGAELSRSRIQTNRDEAIRGASENNRSSLNQLQSLFAGLGTLDSGAFQRLTSQQQAKFAGGQQGLYKQAEQDLNDIEVGLNSARREAQGLIQTEELNLQDKLAQIDAIVQKGTIEYQNAVENAIYEAETKIAGIYDELGQIENEANLKMVEYLDKMQSGQQLQFDDQGNPLNQYSLEWLYNNPDKYNEAFKGQLAQQVTPQEMQERQNTINLIDELLNERNLGTVAGLQGRTGLTTLFGEGANTRAALNQLIGRLVVDERGKLKGQGQISDREQMMLQNAVTRLNTPGLDQNAIRQELNKIKTALGGESYSGGRASGLQSFVTY